LKVALSYAGIIKRQITNLDGLSRTDIDPIPGPGGAAIATDTTQVGTGSPIAAGSGTNIGPITGLDGTSKFIRGTPATVTVTLSPIANHTFAADDGPLPYLTYNVPVVEGTEGARIKALIEDHFSEVYKGTKVGTEVGTGVDTKVIGRVESIEAPYLNALGDLVLTLKFPPKPEVIDETYFVNTVLGDLADAPTDGEERPSALAGVNTSGLVPFTVSPITWTTNDPDDVGEFTSTFTYTATITLTPKSNFTFIDSVLATIEDKLDNTSTGIWGTTVSNNIDLAATAITVTGVAVEPDDDLIESDRDKLVITLKWTL
jgi:hypothetical protein